jgi:hypothetical protein
MNNHLLPTDTSWREDNALVAGLNHLNAEIARYVLRYLDADAGQAEPISPDDELCFGQQVVDLGDRVQRRATRRAVQVNRTGDTAQPRAIESGQQPDMDDCP